MSLAVAAVAGAIAGGIYTLSPMAIWFACGAAAILWVSGRGLPPRERCWIITVLAVAFAIRLALVVGLLVFGAADQAQFNALSGDEQYMIIRSMHQRSLWLALPLTFDPFLDLFDLY